MDPLVDIMISKEIMTYCVKEPWVVGNTVIMVCGHMVFLYNICEREEGTIERNSGGIAIILAPTALVAWKEAGPNSPITKPFDSKLVGRFAGIKMSFPKFDMWGKRVHGFLKLFVALIYHPVDNKEHGEFNDMLSSLVSLILKTV